MAAAKTAKQVNVHDAKTNLSKLLVEVENGREIVVARNGKPIAKLIPFPKTPKYREIGKGKGSVFWISPDFDAPLSDEELKDWGL